MAFREDSGAFRRRLAAGEFAVTAEIGPPRGADTAPVASKAALLRDWVDAVNITDNQSAAVRAAREVAAMRVPPDPKEPLYIARWVINPSSGEIALTKIGKFDAYRDYLPEHHELIASKGWPTSGRAYDLMHRGVASIARDGTILDLGDQSGQGLEEFIATYGFALMDPVPETESGR